MKKLLFIAVFAIAGMAAAEVSFWKDGIAPDSSPVATSTISAVLATAFESRPYSVAMVDNVPISTFKVRGTCLTFR